MCSNGQNALKFGLFSIYANVSHIYKKKLSFSYQFMQNRVPIIVRTADQQTEPQKRLFSLSCLILDNSHFSVLI